MKIYSGATPAQAAIIARLSSITSDDVAGITGANNLDGTYPAVTKKDVTTDMIASFAGTSGTPLSSTNKVIDAAVAGTSATPVSETNKLVDSADPRLKALPIGAIVEFGSSTPPTDFLECDGSAISRTTYASLYAVIGTTHGSGNGSTTFNIPERRGEFPRGWDHSRGIDSGRTFGSAQAAAVHLGDKPWIGNTGGVTVAYGTNVPFQRPNDGAETRPRNIATMYIIKYA